MPRNRKRKPSKRPSDDVNIDAWTKAPAERYLHNNWQFLIGNTNRQLIMYHVVWHGRRRGIFTEWEGDDGAMRQVNGFRRNKHGHADTFDEAVELLLEGLQAEMTVGDLEVPVSLAPQTPAANGTPATDESTNDEMSGIASPSQTPTETSTASSIADEEMLDDEEVSPEPLLSPEYHSSPGSPRHTSPFAAAISEEKPVEPRLCKEQQDALDLALEGRNLFITGSGGCGKSVLVRALFRKLSAKKRVHLLAPTGQAAVNIEGATVHHFMGWGTERHALDFLSSKAKKNKRVYNNVTRTHVLIIDEISMVDNHLFTRLSQTMSKVRHEAAQEEYSSLDPVATLGPFGGIQVIVVGDFYQLPPVLPLLCCELCDANWKKNARVPKCDHLEDTDKWAFKSAEWERCNFSYVHLTKIHRQQDEKFVRILQKCRLGKLDNVGDVNTLLKNHGVENGVRLFSKKDDVKACNDEESRKLSGRAAVYKSLDHLEEQQHNMDDEESLPEARHATSITLKIGMPVMLLANIDVENGFCNGSRGVIRDFASRLHEEPKKPNSENYNGDTDAFEIALRRYNQIRRFMKDKQDMIYPEVEFSNGARRVIGPDCTISRLGTEPYSYWSQVQIPLTPNWAMTIHKSQGMSLDRVVADITNIWEGGQAYVALSRARSLEGLELEGNNLRRTLKGKFRADEEVHKFMDMLEAQAKNEGR